MAQGGCSTACSLLHVQMILFMQEGQGRRMMLEDGGGCHTAHNITMLQPSQPQGARASYDFMLRMHDCFAGQVSGLALHARSSRVMRSIPVSMGVHVDNGMMGCWCTCRCMLPFLAQRTTKWGRRIFRSSHCACGTMHPALPAQHADAGVPTSLPSMPAHSFTITK